MKMFIGHAIVPSTGKRINAGIYSEAPLEVTRDAFEAELEREYPGAVIVGFHESEEEEPRPKPEPWQPLLIEQMVMRGWATMALILFLMRYITRRTK